MAPDHSPHKLNKLARKFIKANRMAALASVDGDGMPHAAPLFCVIDKDLAVYFSTRIEGRKFANLMSHPTVAMCFMNESELSAIQLTGTAERVDDMEQEGKILHELMTLRYHDPNWPIPSVKLFERGSTDEIAIIKVTPFEMTYANFENSRTKSGKSYFQKII